MDIHLLNALGITDCAIFKSTTSLQCLTPDVSWLHKIAILDDDNKVNPDNFSSMFLDDFMTDANDIWQNDNVFTLSSGFWTEENENEALHLEALAINSGKGQHFLVIKNVETQYEEKQKTLQAARELLLSHHEIVGQHEYIRQRLDKTLLKNKNYEKLVPPIKQAIHHLETGVVILDKDRETVLDNKSARQLLSCSRSNDSANRLEHLLQDVSVPDTFLPTLIEKRSAWQGELYWQPTQNYEVWLQVTIHPVIHDNELTHWVYLLTDISHIRNKEESVLSATGMDSLTKIANRNFFNSYVQKLVQEDVKFALFVIDIREFKKINEKLGYHSGDEILKSFASRLQGFVGNSGFIARMGSNEFSIVKRTDTFSGVNPLDYAQDMKKKLVNTYTSLHGAESNLGINIGIASYPQHGDQGNILLRHADIALQIAKFQGKNVILEYSEMLQRQHQSMSELESKLRTAIENNQLALFLQPIVDLQTGKIVKCEALARWKQEDGSYIPPDVFIPIAERTELIFPFGEWLVEEACNAIDKLTEANLDIRLAINISGRQVTDLVLLHQIQSSLKRRAIDPRHLSIELTESVFIDSLDTVSVLLNELRAMGITISIDDFGTGFSSLVYLKKLPIDELKIDRSFVSDLEANTDDQAIIQAILGLAKNLNISIIAEGVETQDQQRFLVDNACSYAQGYYFDKPMSIGDFVEKLR
ncbi:MULTISPECIES: sensor domain-containing protein [Alteromonas]|jgi:diguanylate cyclase (GGDEF)-like protein|uniref:Diguanylate cyclase n=1 Tax=Alteromonas stellipolaris TaxID=233316 RepID=A0AAW7Z2N6_9ALTE|nr:MULTISPECIES: EAL domain-containing protein [Alteromonas]AMJ91966.1 diguanylate cyclase [Alteromonas sp. Mac2]ALM89164.1 diguanylate cyclase/phosphodiesterase (GGDEF & EAL domains) with PAS/PAC sensor [Alteromonas stellipolaris LMG 21856]AMJ75679.1 diguanylate cyclase [Alteromonas stellipolaris]AMJ88104.1 diguanylate cyclase [Alteromonas sp. Mac1]ANB21185.1 diguanylate cyclase [Alteromonas stellipolaris]